MLNNKIFIVIALITALLLGVVFVVIILRSLFSAPAPPDEDSRITPTRSPQDLGQEDDGIRYDEEGTDELLRIVTERPTPPPSDQEIRNSLIQSVGNTTGTLYETEQVKIEYVSAPNDFEVEIRTMDVDTGKEIAIDWFFSQGLSEEGVCSLPVFFHLSYEVHQNLRGTNYTFNPLPEFC